MSEIAKDQSFPRDPDRTDVGVIGGTWTNTVSGVIWDYIGRYNIKADKLMSVGYIWERHVGDNSSAGGGTVTPTATAKAVNFRDYDGTVLYSYTVDEAAALTELPPLPEHSGLICQGWNWSLDNIKAIGRAVEVGAMYITDDGKTRIYIHLEDGRTSPMLGCCPNGTVTVDWGDGTEPDVLTGTSTSTVKWTPTHEYGAAGDYVIKLTVDGNVALAGKGSSNQYSYLLRYSSGADTRNMVYQNAIQKVEIGGSVSPGDYAFYNCYSLSSITLPDGVTSIGDSAFYNCYSLSSITIPDGVTSIGDSAFYNCYSLASVTLPNGVTSIDNHAFYNCYSLSSITIPDGVASIGNYTFGGCYSLSSITLPDRVTSLGNYAFGGCSLSSITYFTHHTAVPTLSATNAFTGIAADCEIRVPAALADEWKAATNWATYADKIVGV